MRLLRNLSVVPILILSSARASAAIVQPNFVFVLADDWGFGDLGVMNSPTGGSRGLNGPQTPRLDRMAAEGTLFTDFHTMGAECSPSRASFMTGRSPSDKAVRIHLVIGDHAMNQAKGCADFLDPNTPTVTSMLRGVSGTAKTQPYTTAHFGKWHLGSFGGNLSTTPPLPGAPPLSAYGIDESVSYGSNPAVNAFFDVPGGHSNPFTDPWFPSNSSKMIVDLGIAFMENATASQRPFYLNLWFHVSHAPLWPTDEQLAAFPTSSCPGPNPAGNSRRCAMQIYRASQHEADRQIGRLLDWIDAAPSGLANNTLVVFSTDNGPEDPHIDMHAVGDPGPFRGRKRSLYEGGVRVPFIARWPGHIPHGRVSNADIASVDWLPTVAALAGIGEPAVPAGLGPLMGRDASALLLGTANSVPRSTPKMFDYRFDNSMQGYCYHGAPRLAMRQGDLKLLTNVDPRFPRTELYNLSSSTFEANDLSADPAYLTTVSKMRTTLLKWVSTLDPIADSMADNAHLGCAEWQRPMSTTSWQVQQRDPWD